MRLLPSRIRYSQSSISNTFTDGELIGEVLDDIYYKRLQKRDFPRIEVAKVNGHWYTADNRRLWVFRQLEKLKKCRRIPVDVIDEIPYKKMTTKNDGLDIKVRGHPGGECIRELESDESYDDDSSDDDLYDAFNDVRI